MRGICPQVVGYGEGSEERLRAASGGTLSIAYHHGSWRKSPRLPYMAGLNISVKFIVRMPFSFCSQYLWRSGSGRKVKKSWDRQNAYMYHGTPSSASGPFSGESLSVRSVICNASFSLRDKEEMERTYTEEYDTIMATVHIKQIVDAPWELRVHSSGWQIPYSIQIRTGIFVEVFHTPLFAEIVHLRLVQQ